MDATRQHPFIRSCKTGSSTNRRNRFVPNAEAAMTKAKTEKDQAGAAFVKAWSENAEHLAAHGLYNPADEHA